MQMLCDKRLDCPTNLLTNYSSEGAEPFPPYYAVVYPPLVDVPIDSPWSMPGCLYICTSYISQEDANLCALRQSVLCTNPPGEEIWYSAPATCTSTCPDGTVFYYTVPAGMFVAHSYAEALAQAQAYACLKAQEERICLGELPRCACFGVEYAASITLTVPNTSIVFSLVGFLPPGLQFVHSGNTAVITGTPTVNGTYAFNIIATLPSGNYSIKTYVIQVLEITSTALPDFTIGTPYSYQLAAAGGSGNYTWRVVTGSLPDGLDLSSTGLISGTPTNTAIGGTLTFEVIDSTCEAATKQFFTPRIALSTAGVTTIKTKRGWTEYIPSTGALYKRLTWTGYQLQLANTAGNAFPFSPVEFCGGARFTYSGFSQIDINGNFIASHAKNLTAACDSEPFPGININSSVSINSLLGYCWETDPGSCGSCSSDEDSWIGMGDYASHSQFDFPGNMLQVGGFASSTPTTWNYNSGGFVSALVLLDGVQNFPNTTYNGTNGPWATIGSQGNWSATLSEEYTDADANNSASIYTNSSAVAENLPNYRQWSYNYLTNRSSRTTHIDYSLTCTNLVVGENYVASVELWSSLGTHSTVQVPFTADATTHQIIGSVPIPAANTTITVKKPSIIFAP